MFLKKAPGRRTATLPNGRIISHADLPDAQTRWVASRKEIVVYAVAYGLITKEEVLARYGLSDEEFGLWVSGIAKHGRDGVKVTAIQKLKN